MCGPLRKVLVVVMRRGGTKEGRLIISIIRHSHPDSSAHTAEGDSGMWNTPTTNELVHATSVQVG